MTIEHCACCLFHKDTDKNNQFNTTCRRYPPQPQGFPVVAKKEWCGEYRPESKDESRSKRKKSYN